MHRTTKRLAALAVLLAASSTAPARADEPTTYAIDTKKSELTVSVFKAGLLPGLGHDHTIRATRFTAAVVYDPAAPAKGSVTLDVEAGSLEVIDPSADADDRAAVKENMDEDVLEVEDHPRIRFVSRSVEALDAVADGHALRVSGDLSLHGVTRRISLDVTVTLKDGRLEAKGSIRLLQTDHDIEPYSAFLGAVAVKDEIQLSFDMVGAERTERSGK